MPTRTGYSFVGWRGRNLVNPNNYSMWQCGESLIVDGNNIVFKTKANTTGALLEGTVALEIEDLVDGKYLLSIDTIDYSGENNWAHITVNAHCSTGVGLELSNICGAESYILYTTEKRKTKFDFNGYFDCDIDGEKIATGQSYVAITTNYSSSFASATVTIENLMLTKVEDENEVVNYEPYYITSDTILNNIGDRTLVAEWTANSNNIFTNGDFEDVYTQTDTGWDNSLNGTLHATGWDDYNPGISNPSTAVHAHIKDISSTDSQHGHVFEMIGAHREYIAAMQEFRSTTKITTGTYRVSASVKGISGQNAFTMGLYYSQTGYDYSSSAFNSGKYRIRLGTTDWFRVTWVFTVTQITYAHNFYFYGDTGDIPDITPSMNNIFYLDDVFLEKIS